VSPKFQLTLIGKPGCHLCDDAEAVVTNVLAEFPNQVSLTKQSILEDDELFARYSEEIPVLLINGKVHNYWRIDADRLREALSTT
jgi:glutaredoxin